MKLSWIAFISVLGLAYAQHEHQHGSMNNVGMTVGENNSTGHHSTSTDNHNSMDMASMGMDALNETAIYLSHGPDPMSFYVHDFESDPHSKPGWMIIHAIGMTLSFGILLPIGLALKAGGSPLYGLINIIFLSNITFCTICSSIYKKITPDLYENSAHGKLGWFTLVFIAGLSGYDAFKFTRSFIRWYKSSNRSLKSFKVSVLSNSNEHDDKHYAAVNDDDQWLHESDGVPLYQTSSSNDDVDEDENVDSPSSQTSRRSDLTLNDEQPDHLSKPTGKSHQLTLKERLWASSHYLKVTFDRTTFVLGFTGIVTGIVSYSGICHAKYLNGCLAHLIKGGIFFGYGLLTFGRFCGAFAEVGWSWNLKPRKSLGTWRQNFVSAELVESAVIFTYGATNTFMERFGAKHGDPWSMKQVQHASIAVMFFFIGGLGLLIELPIVRKLFGNHARDQPNPNPFPALAIGITGFAMASHHQEYAFAVSQHALFGNLLALYALCRCMTYAIIYMKPIKSDQPTKPISEVLASFFLTSGGLAFMFSIEEFTFTAYRRGFAHLMFLLNTVVSLTGLALFWVAFTMAVKSWSYSRNNKLHFNNDNNHNDRTTTIFSAPNEV